MMRLAPPVTAALLLATMPSQGAEETAWASFLRTQPDFAAPVLREVPRGAPYEMLGCADGWCRVSLAGTAGFLPANALSAPPALRPGAGRDARPSDCIGFLRPDRSPELLCREAQGAR